MPVGAGLPPGQSGRRTRRVLRSPSVVAADSSVAESGIGASVWQTKLCPSVNRYDRRLAPVAQWIERRPPEPDRLSVVASRVGPRAKRAEFCALSRGTWLSTFSRDRRRQRRADDVRPAPQCQQDQRAGADAGSSSARLVRPCSTAALAAWGVCQMGVQGRVETGGRVAVESAGVGPVHAPLDRGGQVGPVIGSTIKMTTRPTRPTVRTPFMARGTGSSR